MLSSVRDLAGMVAGRALLVVDAGARGGGGIIAPAGVDGARGGDATAA
jgi:hypothetical protein